MNLSIGDRGGWQERGGGAHAPLMRGPPLPWSNDKLLNTTQHSELAILGRTHFAYFYIIIKITFRAIITENCLPVISSHIDYFLPSPIPLTPPSGGHLLCVGSGQYCCSFMKKLLIGTMIIWLMDEWCVGSQWNVWRWSGMVRANPMSRRAASLAENTLIVTWPGTISEWMRCHGYKSCVICKDIQCCHLTCYSVFYFPREIPEGAAMPTKENGAMPI